MKIIVLLIVGFVAACKRSLSIKEAKPNKRMALVKNEVSIQHLPIELFMEIFLQVLDSISLKRNSGNPLLLYKLVSSHWNRLLSDSNSMEQMKRHPCMALVLLKKNFHVGGIKNQNLLQVASAIIDLDLAVKLVLNASKPKAFEQLAKLPILQKSLSSITYEQYLVYARKYKHLSGKMLPIIDDDDFDEKLLNHKMNESKFARDPRGYLEDHFENSRKLVLSRSLSQQIVRILILDDMFDPMDFNAIFSFAMKQILKAYHKNRHEKAKSLMSSLRYLTLPGCHFNALNIVLLYPLFLASLIAENAFFDFVNPNFEDAASSFSFPEIDKILLQFKNKEITEYPAERLSIARNLLKMRADHGFLGFSREKITARKEVILSTPGLSAAVLTTARRYL